MDAESATRDNNYILMVLMGFTNYILTLMAMDFKTLEFPLQAFLGQ